MKKLAMHSRATILLVFIFQFITLQRIMRLDPDAHHDGILYGAAVSVRNGGIPNRDAFAQYGPLVPEIQGLALHFFGPSLLHIRMQALFLFLIASIAIWGVARLYLSNRLALLISTTWALTVPTVLPWPTIYSTVLAIASLLLLVDLKNKNYVRRV